MTEAHEILVERIRGHLTQGKLVLVIGWIASNHSAFTHKLPRDKVRFYEKLPLSLPHNTGIALFTRFTSHPMMKRAQAEANTYSKVLNTGEIQRILRTLLPEFEQATTTSTTPESENAVTRHLNDLLPLAAPLVTQRGAGETENKELLFAKRFLKKTGPDPDAQLSKFEVSQIIRETIGEKTLTAKLVQAGWIEPMIGKGHKKAGAYKAGPKMLELHTAPEPTDPIERARWIISHEDELLERKREAGELFEVHRLAHISEVEKIDRDLARVNELKVLFGKLETAMS